MDYYNRSSAANSYVTLGSYNIGAGPMAPVPSDTPSMGTIVVPSFGTLGYNALTHGVGQPTNGGYFTVKSAYPAYDTGCMTFTSRLCS